MLSGRWEFAGCEGNGLEDRSWAVGRYADMGEVGRRLIVSARTEQRGLERPCQPPRTARGAGVTCDNVPAAAASTGLPDAPDTHRRQCTGRMRSATAFVSVTGTMRYGCRIGEMFPGAIRHPRRALQQAWYVASSGRPTSPVSRRLPPARMPAADGHALRRYRLRKYQNRRSWLVPPTLPRRGSGCPRCLKLTLASSTSISRACRRARHWSPDSRH